MPRPPLTTTVRERLILQTTVLCLLLLALAGGAIFLGVRAALLSNLDGALLGIARAELASALDAPNGKVHIHEDSQLMLQGAAGYEKYAMIRDEHGDLAAHTANVLPGQLPPLDHEVLNQTESGVAVFGDLTLAGRRLRAVYYPFRDRHGEAFVAVCAVPYAPMQDSLRSLALILFLTLTVAGAGAMWGATRLARRLTDPLEELARRTQQIGEESLHERLPQLSQDAELVGLTEGINAMLGRLDLAFAERQRLIEAQRQFLMDASHELRTPVSNLRGTLEVALRRERSADAYRETLETCLPESERLSVLVNDLLLLARADTGTFPLARTPLDLAQLSQQALQAHEAAALHRSVHLRYDGPTTFPLTADPTRLRQVLDNLLDNALRFAPTETAVTLTLTPLPGAVALTVEDQGPGITPDDLPHLFERFWRADASRARATGGLGLGLAIVRSLIEAHGGNITVESAPGQGARFRVTLPTAPLC